LVAIITIRAEVEIGASFSTNLKQTVRLETSIVIESGSVIIRSAIIWTIPETNRHRIRNLVESDVYRISSETIAIAFMQYKSIGTIAIRIVIRNAYLGY
jgi:hypothetical protein